MLLPSMAPAPPTWWAASPYNSGGSRKKGGTLNGLVAGTAPGGGGYGGAGARSEATGGSDNQGAHTNFWPGLWQYQCGCSARRIRRRGR